MTKVRPRVADAALLERLDQSRQPIHYLACPVSCYGTDRYTRTLRRLATAGGELALGAPGLFPTTAHWRQWWPPILERLAAVTVLGATDGTVGRGVWNEVHDAWTRRLPVRWDGPGRPHEIKIGALAVINEGSSLRRYATLAGTRPRSVRRVG
jgi:hypothetical protein